VYAARRLGIVQNVTTPIYERRTPWATYLLIAVNVVVFLVVPAHRIAQLPAVLSVPGLVFTHDGWLRLVTDVLFLWMFGRKVEARLGRLRLLLFYLLCGYAAAYGAAFLARQPVEPLVAAAGAVSGVLGAYLALSPRARLNSLSPFPRLLPKRPPAWLAIVLWFALQWVYALFEADLVALGACVIGFLAGALAAVPLLRRRPQFAYQRRRRPHRAT
jgi:membrane associated rhomboid family serine protease